MKRLLIAALAIALVGCEPSELRPIPFPAAGGGGTAPPPARTQPGQPIAPGADRMLQDPEGELSDGAIEVVASSVTQAENICADIAARRSDQTTIVQCLGCRKRTKTTGKYICTLRTETVILPPSEQTP